MNTRIPGYQEPGYQDTRIGYHDTMIPGYQDTMIPGYQDRIPGYQDTMIP